MIEPGLNANGPAIKGGCVIRREHRAESWFFSREVVTVQGGYGTCFCRPGTNLIEYEAYRVTSWLGDWYTVKVPESYKTCTGAVSAVQFVSEPENSQGIGF